jgi:hypothetical protein
MKAATHNAVILDYEVPLCGACAKAWPRIWAEALEAAPGNCGGPSAGSVSGDEARSTGGRAPASPRAPEREAVPA